MGDTSQNIPGPDASQSLNLLDDRTGEDTLFNRDMLGWRLSPLLVFVLYLCQISVLCDKSQQRLPIVFVYTVVPAVCKHGLPDYIRISVEQAIYTQPDCDVIMASNYGQCEQIAKTVASVPGLIQIDTTTIESNITRLFANLSASVFESDYAGELWMTSALRFFILEDIMASRGYTEMVHVEADNTLYGRLTTILPTLRRSYPLAATPLTANNFLITASVFWISSPRALAHFNSYMMGLIVNEQNSYKQYLAWMRRFACCKKGGVDPDENGNGIKPFAINEMSMLANYHRLHPGLLKLLPVAPAYTGYLTKRPFCNVSEFAPGGKEVGPATGHGIWDPNSWGQHIGGTSRKRGRDKGFVDASHIAGQGIFLGKCTVSMMCGNQTTQPPAPASAGPSPYEACYTAPHVRCGEAPAAATPWTPLWNLHVHSKHTANYRSLPCDCPTPSAQL